MNIVFACGNAFETWNPAIARERGVGGSELAVIEMSRRLTAQGHEVTVYTNCGRPMPYDGVHWRPTHELLEPCDPIVCDVLVLWRNAGLVDCGVRARATFLWVHDVHPNHLTMARLAKIDRVIALSAWHRAVLVAQDRIPPEKIVLGGAGVDCDEWEEAVKHRVAPFRERRWRAVYTSSPDRGLDTLLRMWPRIQRRAPGAELAIAYGFDNAITQAKALGDETRLAELAQLRDDALALEPMGVRLIGRLPRGEYRNLLAGAEAWLYPTHYDETACAAAMEAQACGLGIVASARAALRETVGDRGFLVEGDPASEAYQDTFVGAAAAAIAPSTAPWEERIGLARRRDYAREHFHWDAVLARWIGWFTELLGCAASTPASSPTEPGRRGGAGVPTTPPSKPDPGPAPAGHAPVATSSSGIVFSRKGRPHTGPEELLVLCPPDMRSHVVEVLEGAYDVPGLTFATPPAVLDIGACVGDFTLWAASRWPGAKVTAYEPNPRAVEYLGPNLAQWPELGAEVRIEAVRGSDGEDFLYFGPSNLGEASFRDDDGKRCKGTTVRTTAAQRLPVCDVLKIDTEGCEREILLHYFAGLEAKRATFPRAVLLEFHSAKDRVRLDHILSMNDYELVRGRIQHAAMGVLCYVRRGP